MLARVRAALIALSLVIPGLALAGGPGEPDALSVIACGADPTFTQDSTAAIQACADQAFGPPGARHGANAAANRPLYFPPGHYKISAPIVLQFVHGGVIFGAGRFTSTIENVAGAGVFKTDGFEFGEVRDLTLQDDGKTSPVFDLDWPSNATIACQSNTFSDLYVQGGAVGVRIGHAGYMCSENLFLNDFVQGSVHGYEVDNYNALQNTLMGGNIAGCQVGVLVISGTMSVYNTGFQGDAVWDYQQINQANDAIVLSGSRTESANFASIGNGITATISGISQTSATPGALLKISGGHAFVSGVHSVNGQVVLNKGAGEITASAFGRADWLDLVQPGSGFRIIGVEHGYRGTAAEITDKTVN